MLFYLFCVRAVDSQQYDSRSSRVYILFFLCAHCSYSNDSGDFFMTRHGKKAVLIIRLFILVLCGFDIFVCRRGIKTSRMQLIEML